MVSRGLAKSGSRDHLRTQNTRPTPAAAAKPSRRSAAPVSGSADDPGREGIGPAGVLAIREGRPGTMFFFFSNRLGCLGSLAMSAVLTVVLLLILGVLH